jgi:3-deoxy-manno-octulosonate cytidylyltransferase (CMP-KDO synthetase)
VILGTNKRALYFSRSVIPHLRRVEEKEWQLSHTYYKHIGLYAYRSDVLREITKLKQSPLELAESLEQLRWIENGYQINAEITNLETIAIDTPDDLDRAIDWARANFLRG